MEVIHFIPFRLYISRLLDTEILDSRGFMHDFFLKTELYAWFFQILSYIRQWWLWAYHHVSQIFIAWGWVSKLHTPCMFVWAMSHYVTVWHNCWLSIENLSALLYSNSFSFKLLEGILFRDLSRCRPILLFHLRKSSALFLPTNWPLHADKSRE